MEARLNNIISEISLAQRNNQFSNVSGANLIELLNFQVEKMSNAEKQYEKRLEDACQEVC